MENAIKFREKLRRGQVCFAAHTHPMTMMTLMTFSKSLFPPTSHAPRLPKGLETPAIDTKTNQ